MGTGFDDLGIDALEEHTGDDGDLEAADTATRTAPAKTGEPSSTLDPEELIRHLRQITLFEGLLPVHLRRIAALAQELSYAKGTAVFEHGDPGDGLYLILKGAVRISRTVAGIGEEALAVLRPGMYFGEMSIIDDEAPRSADAIAHEQTLLLKLPKDDLRDLMFVDRELAYELLWRFVRTLSARLRDSNDRLLMLTVSSKF